MIKQITPIKRSKFIFIVISLLPAVLIYSVFYIYPALKAFYISLCEWSGYSPKPIFIGLANFKQLIKDKYVWSALKHNVDFFVIPTIITLALSLFFASLLSSKEIKGRDFFRITYFFPNVISAVAMAVLWSFIFNPSFGILNWFLKSIGLSHLTHTWLGEKNTALPALTIPSIWGGIGFTTVLLLAAMYNIPTTLYEAAEIDGANKWHRFYHITFPLIWEIMRIVIIFSVIGALKKFEIIYLLTAGGPDRATDVIALRMYYEAFSAYKMGYGTAISVWMFILVFILTLISMKLTKKEKVEY